MSELIALPAKGHWAFHTAVNEASLKATLAATNHRLISIKSYVSAGNRVLAAVSIENVGIVTDWNARITEPALRGLIVEGKTRLISLDAFTEADGTTFCAAVWIKSDGSWWSWAIDLTESTLKSVLADEHGKLTCLRSYNQNEAISQAAVDRKYAALWIKDDGKPWEYRPKISNDDLYKRLIDGLNGQYSILSLDAFVEGSDLEFAAVYWKDASPNGWYWFFPISGPDLDERTRGLCCYPMDVCQAWPDTFAVAQFAYPALAHSSAATLVSVTGNGVINAISNELIQSVFAQPEVTNLTAEVVTLLKAVRIQAGPDGWSWFWQASLNATDPGQVFNAPNTLPAGSAPLPGGGFTYASSQPMQYSITQIEAKSATGKFHQSFACIPLTAPGGVAVPPLVLSAPVFVGLQGPLEVLLMTDGRRLLEIKGQIINLSGRKMKIQGVFLRLVSLTNDTAYHAVLPLDFMIDTEADGTPLNTAIAYDPTIHQDRPLPRFRHLIEVPTNYLGGTLEVEIHIQSESPYPDVPGGTIECSNDKRTFPVVLGSGFQIASPVKGKYRWGSGPGAVSWNAHFFFHERYAYDIIKVEVNERGEQVTNKAGTTGANNEDALCWDNPIFCVADGEVIFVRSGEVDHAPNPAPGTGGEANMVVIKSDGGRLFHVYVHLKKDSATVLVGQAVNKGDMIGRIGNTGNSSGPHLHFGIYSYDPLGTALPTGVLRPLPISLDSSISTHSVPTRVPIDGAVIDS